MSSNAIKNVSGDDSPDTGYLKLDRVNKRFGDAVVLDGLSAGVSKGEFVSLLGPSGCGKTTMLRLIAGLLTADSGTVSVEGRDLTRVPAHKRNIGVVFQSYALFPHLSVAENIAFGLQAQNSPKREIADKVSEALSLVRMDDYAERSISALSGGQQQRVAVARALVVRPRLLLLDEPFSALDRNLRETMQIELRALLRRQGITSIFVTHDQDEALVMSDRIAVMNAGRIEHFGSPTEIYRHPQSVFVMEFVGQSTQLAGSVIGHEGDHLIIETALARIKARGAQSIGQKVVVGVRPELVTVSETAAADPSSNSLEAILADTVYLGSKTVLYFQTPNAGDRVLAEVAGLAPVTAPGASVKLGWPISETMVFPCN